MISAKKYFVTGLLVWAPLAITIWVIVWMLGTLDSVFGWMIGVLTVLSPDSLQPVLLELRDTPGIGVILVLLGILVTGAFAANIFGQWALRQWDKLLARIPIVKSIYSSVKQVSDTLFSSNGHAFRKALLVPYPRPGVWAIAFLTGTPGGDVVNHLKGDYVSVYLPTTPNPTSGFFLMFACADVIELDMSVDEALKYIVSMGVVAPAHLPMLP
ncbi:MAG: DUF502 domain-containing protein [Ottowia sp.]|nr:DUF502 domain-containing protein [Ottowia sp.]